MRKLLVDSGPLYALVDRDDRLHERALEESERLVGSGIDPVIIFPVLTECHTLVLRRLGLPFAHQWIRQHLEIADLLNPIRDDYLHAAERLRQLEDQPITMVDALLATLSEQLHLPIWTFDHHFDVMRSTVWRG